MRKGILFVISCLLFATFVSAQTAVTGVSLSSSSLTLGIGQWHLLTPTVIPITATNQNVSWTTSDASIATVYHGSVTAIKVGTVDIIVSTDEGNFKDTCEVTVTTIPVTGVSLDKKTLHLKCGECYQLKSTIAPISATDKSVSYISENEDIATVSPTGLIWAGDPDTTLIIVETNDGNFKDTCEVIVEVPNTVSVREVSLDKKHVTLAVGNTFLLEETILPKNATNKKVFWSSNNYSIVDVVSGLVTAKNPGSAYIYVKTADKEKIDSCFINVIPEDFVHIDAKISTNESGIINFSINTPESVFLSEASFLIEFPEGVIFDENTTKLSTEYESKFVLTITNKNNNSWLIEIKEKAPVIHVGTLQDIMDIGLKIDNSATNGNYNITFSQINVKLSDGSELNKDLLNIKVDDDTAADLIEITNVKIYQAENQLYIQSIYSEIIYIYSFNGTLLHTQKKMPGETILNINTQESAFIIKGSTGWVKKISR